MFHKILLLKPLGDTVVNGTLQVKANFAGATPLCASNIGVNMTISMCAQNVGDKTNVQNSAPGEIQAVRDENRKLQEEVKQMQTELEALKAIVCAANPSAAVCQPKQ